MSSRSLACKVAIALTRCDLSESGDTRIPAECPGLDQLGVGATYQDVCREYVERALQC